MTETVDMTEIVDIIEKETTGDIEGIILIIVLYSVIYTLGIYVIANII